MITDTEKDPLITEHALLAAKFAAHDTMVVPRMKEIEDQLMLSATEIANKVADIYTDEY